MSAATIINPTFTPVIADDAEFVMLQNNQLLRVTAGKREIHVISGRAWLSFEGRDYILTAGERLTIHVGAEQALLSPAKLPHTLTVEIA